MQSPVARTPCGPGPSRASEPRPLLRHELTHPGISMPSPDSALVRCSRRHALGPRSPRVARRRFGIGGAAAAVITTPPKLPPLTPLGILGRSPWRDAEVSPTRMGDVGVPRVWLSRERRRGPSSGECGYRAFHRQIRRPRLQPEGGGGSCRCLHGDALGFAGSGGCQRPEASPAFAVIWGLG